MHGQFRPNERNAAFWSSGWMLGAAFGFSFFTTMLMLSIPLFMLLVYDRVLSARSQESLVALFVLVVLLLVLMALFDYARRRLLARFGARLQERLELRVLAAAEARAPRAAQGTGPVSGTKELDRLRGFFNSGAMIAILDVAWAPIFLGAVFLFHPMLGWVAVTGVVALFAVLALQGLFTAHLAEDAGSAAGMLNETARQIRDTQATIASQNMGGSIVERWRTARQNARDMSIVLADRVTWFTSLSRALRLLFQAMILALGANLVLQNQLTVGGMVACFILIGRVFGPVETFLRSLPTIGAARENWAALGQTLADAPQTMSATAPAVPQAGLEVRNVSVAPRVGGPVLLTAIDLAVAPGSIVQITGAPGSGKTILARALAGEIAPAGGAVAIGGRNIELLGSDEFGNLFGQLSEDVGFFPGTIAENIAQMRTCAPEREIVAAARRIGAHRLIMRLPKGYATELDRRGTGLSRGERQRIALARAVYGKPSVVVIDDTSEVVPAACGLFSKGCPAIVILSRTPRRLMRTSRHYRLEDGRLSQQPDLAGTQDAAAPLRTPQLVKG